MSKEKGCGSASSLFGKYKSFSVILLVVKDKKYFRNTCILCRPIQTREHFHDVPSCHLIFLLHPAALHENTSFHLPSISLETDITPLSFQEP